MIETLRNDSLSFHGDWFLFVIERPEFLRSSAEFDAAVQTLERVIADQPQHVADRIRLGLDYTKRLHSDESSEQILASIERIAARTTGDMELQLIARIVAAVICMLRHRDFAGAVQQLRILDAELRFCEHDVLYGIVKRWLANGFSVTGDYAGADVAYQDALAVFRRYKLAVSYAATMNDYAVLKKRMGCYEEARYLLREAGRTFDAMDASRNKVLVASNLGIVATRAGNWVAAEKHFATASALCEQILVSDASARSPLLNTPLQDVCRISQERLLLLKRDFDDSETRLLAIVADAARPATSQRVLALAHEFLGELYTEMVNHDRARYHLKEADAIASDLLPHSDVMTEVLRRRAQLALDGAQLSEGVEKALQCIHLSKKIGDRYELGAATRVLGEIYAAQGNAKRAKACFAAAVSGLKSIHECYELMRTLYAQGSFLATQGKLDDAEMSLLEARQLAKKLELDYYQALIAIALIGALIPQERWGEASAWLEEAVALRDNLQGIDYERVEKLVERVSDELQQAITRASVREAETLKTICRVYEDARFPIAEMKPDLAYLVAQSVGAASMFVAGKRGGGFNVPLTYNIAVNDAKEIVRQLDTASKKSIMSLGKSAQVLTTGSARTIVAIPCHVTLTNKERTKETYVFCALFDRKITVTSRQMEILCASNEALARLIEDDGERHAPPTPEQESRTRRSRGSFKEILTIDAGMIKVMKIAEKAAMSVAPILLEGETGVGKELFARAIHQASKRKEGPFVAVNAGGMSLSLLESELFGHVRGAFTDARSDRMGVVDTARGGTLFLDEIGEMSEELQVKLLRLLENGEYRRLGESAVRQADVRVISATNRDLKDAVEKGLFRRDLYYRLAPIRLTIPPLRMRAGDIQLMVRHFLRDCAQMNGIADRNIEIDVKAMEALELYNWPGNVRELFNEILRLVSLIGRGDLIRFSLLSEHIQEYLHEKKRGTEGLLERSVEQYERRLILHALERNDWNHLRTAESIGVPRTTLLAKLKRLNIATKL
jgi:transcriptional regulator with PAS, ATPase and Fis domain/tetratricopeptide (TPR) repeat protein